MAAGGESNNAVGIKEEVRIVTGTLSAKVKGETSPKDEHLEEEMPIERSATPPEFLLWSPLELPSIFGLSWIGNVAVAILCRHI